MLKYKTGGSPYFEIGPYRFSFSNPDLHSKEDKGMWKWVTVTGEPSMTYMKKGKKRIAAGKDVMRTTVKAATFTSFEGSKNIGPTRALFGDNAKLRMDVKKTFVKWGKKSKDEYIHKEHLKGLHDDLVKVFKQHGAIDEETLIDKINLIIGEE